MTSRHTDEPGVFDAFLQPLGGVARLAAQLLASSPDGVLAYDSDLRYVFWNPVMERISGVAARDALGRSALDLFPSLKEAGHDRELRRVLAGETVIAQTGREGIFEGTYCPLRDGAGRVVGILGRVRDLTERNAVLERLRETEQRFRTMADNAPVLLWMSGTDAECDFFNQRWLEFTGRTMEEEVGVGWAEGVHHEDLQRVLDVYLDAFSRRIEFRMEYRLRRKDGEYRWVLDHGTPRYTPQGEFTGYIGSCTDITDRRRSEEEMRATADQLIRSNQELERFAQIASHDLREPLRTVTNYTQRLVQKLGDGLDRDAREYADFIVEGSRRMRQLIEDLLLYARVHKEEHPFERLDTAAIVAEVIEGLGAAVAESGAKITVGPLPRVSADRRQTFQLFQNLIANAVKFRSDKAPEIRVWGKQTAKMVEFTVADNGIGLEMKHAERIFVLFQRLHNRDRYPGSGVGLSLCKRIVDRHGGRIWVQSRPGLGSEFHFTLPAGRSG